MILLLRLLRNNHLLVLTLRLERSISLRYLHDLIPLRYLLLHRVGGRCDLHQLDLPVRAHLLNVLNRLVHLLHGRLSHGWWLELLRRSILLSNLLLPLSLHGCLLW